MAMPVSGLMQDLGTIADHIEAPDGYRVEIIEGKIVVSPTPLGSHALLASRVQYALRGLLPAEWEIVQYVTLAIPATGERYIPDLAVLPSSLLTEEIWKFPSQEALLTVEITSPSNAETDRVKKPRGYARGEVPAYLLIDPENRRWTLFEEPENGVYRKQMNVTTGDDLLLQDPFTGPLRTSVIG
ncbi:Uma2 family endonuclease [Nocardiopsis composta]|uniref:Uma2 family endonuclease n=1 Tax=Nocardiopsis composta TaxID=157465 RepID=A0A7W8QLN9_9ACTN|nr:Uma2 family endonuclease [Nocardiopsis composta]MBB5432559.1 Uma2 family endonuclease [Nocardiopsis composta]